MWFPMRELQRSRRRVLVVHARQGRIVEQTQETMHGLIRVRLAIRGRPLPTGPR